MRLLALLLISAISLASSSAFAASYQQNDGTIVDPIQSVSAATTRIRETTWSRARTWPARTCTNADLHSANLRPSADLTGANLPARTCNGWTCPTRGPDRRDLTAARYPSDLTGADLDRREPGRRGPDNADLSDAILDGRDLSGH